MNISTGEAAARLGMSEATVKRRLAEGVIPGAKVGGRWIVFGDKLPAAPSSLVDHGALQLDVGRAFAQVRKNDRRDLWVPDVLNWEDAAQDPSGLLERVLDKAASASLFADPVEMVEVPKGQYLTRGAALLSLEDRVLFQAIANEFAPHVESRLSDRVFSSRLKTGGAVGDFFLPGATQWKTFLTDALERQETEGPWLVSTDLVSYFDTISHRLLFSQLEALGLDDRLVRMLRRLIDQWRGDSHHGLPMGPEASRLFGNFFLVPVDAFMLNKGFSYSRYMDDVRIVATTKHEALRALRLLEIECRRWGLVINSAKTNLTDEYASADDMDLAAADYFFHRRIDESRPVLRDLLKQALAESRPKIKHAKFALLRLAALVDEPALEPVLERLDSLQEAAKESATFLRAFISDAKVQAALTEYLDKTPEPLLEVYQQAWLIAAMLEVLRFAPREWVDYARSIADDRNQPAYLRVLALNLVAKGGEAHDIERVRAEIRMTYDPAILRGCVVALARVDALDRESGALAVSRAPGVSRTVSYLKGRRTLPSLVQDWMWSPIRGRGA